MYDSLLYSSTYQVPKCLLNESSRFGCSWDLHIIQHKDIVRTWQILYYMMPLKESYSIMMNHSKTNQSSISSSISWFSLSYVQNLHLHLAKNCLINLNLLRAWRIWGMFYAAQLCNKVAAPTPRTTNKDLGGQSQSTRINLHQFTIHSICSCITLIHVVCLFIVSLGALCNCHSICSIMKK